MPTASPTHFRSVSPLFAPVFRLGLCRPKASLLAASTVARRKFSFSDYDPPQAYIYNNDQLAALCDL